MNEHFDSKPNEHVVRSAKIMHLCAAVLFVIAGVLVGFVPDLENIPLFGNVAIGIASIIIGATGIYGYFSNDMYRLAFQSDFALGIFNVVLGILLIINPVQLPELLPTTIAILTLLEGGNKSQIAVEGQRFGIHKWYLVLISALLEIAMGVVLLVLTYQGQEASVNIHPWMGAAMCLVGSVNFFTTMYTVRLRGKHHNLTDR